MVPTSTLHPESEALPHSESAVPLAQEITSDYDSDSDSSSYDAAEEIFKQGEYLRMLRQLEREDEAMREKERQQEQENSPGDNNTLLYEDYLRNQEGNYAGYKHVNYQFIDFGIINAGNSSECDTGPCTEAATPLIIEQDRTVGKGGFVWDAGFILAESVLNMEQKETEWLGRTTVDAKPTKIIELGAGTGVTSLIIAKAHSQTTVHLTDLPVLQPLLSKNCQICPGRATHGVLEWGKPIEDNAKYDIILAADVVAGIYDSSGLAKTIYDLSHEKTVVYLACQERLAGVIDRFESYMHELFTKVEKRQPQSSNLNPDVFIMRVSGKRVYGNGDEPESDGC